MNVVIKIDDERIKGYPDWVAQGSVEETLNVLIDAAADHLCNSAVNLVPARLHHIADTRWSTRRYLNLQLMNDNDKTNATA